MAEPNWESTELNHILRIEMTDAVNRSSTLGIMDAVSDSASVTMDVTTDTIGQASVEFLDWSQWIENSWLRIVHIIPEYDFKEILGTFFVYNDGLSYKYGAAAARPALYSSLKGLTLDHLPRAIFIGKGAPITKVIGAILGPCFIKYDFDATCGEYYYTSTYVIDAGTTRMEALLSVLKDVGWEYKLNGDASITFSKKTPFASRSWVYTLDSKSTRSVIEENSIKPEDTRRETPSRAIVIWKGDDSEDTPVSAYADVDPSNAASPQRRGYIISEVHELSDLPGERTAENALVYAKNFLLEDSQATKRWSLKTLWLPIKAGDCIMFRAPEDDTFKKNYVESVEYDLSKWKLDLTIREVLNEWSPDQGV